MSSSIPMNTGIVLGIHISFEKGVNKYGSIEDMPQYPIFKKFAGEGKVTVFTTDKTDYTEYLPDKVTHFRIYNKVLFMLMSWLIISVISRRNKLDFIYYHSASAIFGLPFTNRLSGARTILYYGVMLHVNQHGTVLRPLYYWYEKIVMKWVDYCIVCSGEIGIFLRTESWFRGEVLPIPKFIRMHKPNKRFKRDPKQVIWVGRMDEVKDPLSMICLWAFVGSRVPDAKLTMCGGGSMLRDMRLIAKALNQTYIKHKIKSRVVLTGQVYDIPKRLQKAGILVSTSEYEGSPDNIIEGMGMGLPVVATDVGGTSDFVCDAWNGALIGRDETDWMSKFAKAVIWMLENPKVAGLMGAIGQELAWERHDMNKALIMLTSMMHMIKDSDGMTEVGIPGRKWYDQV